MEEDDAREGCCEVCERGEDLGEYGRIMMCRGVRGGERG